jgi:hypothetical protein
MASKKTAPESSIAVGDTTPSFNFKVKRVVTSKTLELKNNVAVFVKIQGPFDSFPIRSNRDPVEGILEPRVVRVTDLTTGELCEVTMGNSLQRIFEDHYPDNAYVGASFRITRIGMRSPAKQKGQRSRFRNDYDVQEIEV